MRKWVCHACNALVPGERMGIGRILPEVAPCDVCEKPLKAQEATALSEDQWHAALAEKARRSS